MNRTETGDGRPRAGRRPDTVFWVDPGAVTADRVVLDAEESRHLLHVHRASIGSPFTAVDGAGGTYECVLESSSGRLAEGRILERKRDRGEIGTSIGLIAGLGDIAAAEALVELTVPLGVGTVDLAATARSGRPPLEPLRLDRLHRVARAAVKQARRSRLPAIRSSASLEGALELAGPGKGYFADADGGAFASAPGSPMEHALIIAVGPPGGFDQAERCLLLEREFTPISLGPSRLRTHLAAATLLALVRNVCFVNELRGV